MVAPAVAYGSSGEHAGFAGTLSIGQAAIELLLVELVRSADGWRGVVLVHGHGGNADPVARAVATLEAEGRRVLSWWPRLDDGDLHAGRIETAMMLALRPASVKLERAEPGVPGSARELLAALRAGGVRSVSPNGVLGDPTGASARGRPTAPGPARRRPHRRRRPMAPALRRSTVTAYVLDPSCRRLDRGRALLGGSPLRLFRLSPSGVAVLDRLVEGDDLAAAAPPGAVGRLIDRLLDAGAIHPRPTEGPFRAADVTVVIPAFGVDVTPVVDGLGEVGRVLVVDDGSSPPLAPVAGAELVRRATNGGPGAARMTALDLVDTPLVAFVDADVVPRPGWLEPLLAHLGDPRVGLAAPRVASRAVTVPVPGRHGGPHHQDWRRPTVFGALRGGPVTARPRPRRGPGPGPHPDLLRARRRPARANRSPPSRGRLRHRPARGRGRRPGVAARRGRMALPLRPEGRGRPPASSHTGGVGRTTDGLRPLRRSPGPPPPGRAGPRRSQWLERRRVGPDRRRAGPSRRPGSRWAPRSPWPASSAPCPGRSTRPCASPASAPLRPGASWPRP